MANEINITKHGFVILPLYIKPKGLTKMEVSNYKVDTGVNCTTISYHKLSELGFNESWIKTGKPLEGEATPTLASGLPIDKCYEVILPEIRIGEWVGYNWPFITSLSVLFKFLLGTDSMQFFNWHFDYERGICRFDLIQGKRKLLFNQKEQSIHSIDDTSR